MTSPLQGFVRQSRLAGKAGDIADNMFNDKLSYTNDDPRAAQVDTVTIDTATDTEVYSIFIDGIEISFTAASAVEADIATGLAAAVNAEPLVNGRVVATTSTADLILTASVPGVGFTTAEGQNAAKMTLVNTTANATAAAVEFGRAVMANGLSSGSNKLAKLVDAATMTALQFTLTPVPGAGTSITYSVDVTVDGVGYHAQFTDDGTPTVAEIVTGLQAELAAVLPASVTAVDNTTNLLLNAATAGQGFSVAVGTDDAAASSITVASNSGDVLDDKIVGVTLRDLTETTSIIDGESANYPGGSAMGVMHDGRVFVEVEEDLSDPSDGVYVRVAASGSLDKLGGFSTAAGTGLVKWNKARWVRQAGSGLAILEVNL